MLEKIIKLFDKYNREARVIPALLSLMPGIIFISSLGKLFFNIYYGLFSGSVMLFIVLYFSADVIRNIGKYFEKRSFKNELSFPTTEVLLHNNDFFSVDKKQKIYKKINHDIDVLLSTKKQEAKNEKEARKKINEAVGQIRQGLRNNPLLLQANIRYGLWRNLISVSLFSFCLSVLLLLLSYIIFNDFSTSIMEFSFACFFLSIWIYRQKLLNYFGYQYAEQFFWDYLNQVNK